LHLAKANTMPRGKVAQLHRWGSGGGVLLPDTFNKWLEFLLP
jgi:hypothetical protein